MLRSGLGRRLVASLAFAALLLATVLASLASAQSSDALLFDSRVLHRIELQVSERDWDTLRERYTSNTYYPATFLWQGQTVRNVGIRSRGSGTRSGVKPGLLIDFDRYVSDQRFLGLKALVLDNHLQDPSGMREAVTMALLEKLGLPAPRAAHAELHINGQFFGVYAIVENIDSVSTARMFSAPRAEPPTASPEPTPASPTIPAGATRTGRVARLRNPPPPGSPPPPGPVATLPTGFLFEYNWLDYFYETYLGFELGPYADILEAETHENEPLETLYRPIELMFREINEAPADRFVERVTPHLDLPLYVRLVAVQVFMADWDGIAGDFGANNFYLYRPAAGGPHTLIPWDADNAFHNLDYGIDAPLEKHVLMQRAMQVPALRQLYLETLEKAAQAVEAPASGGTGGWLEWEISRRHALVEPSHRQDRVKPHSDGQIGAAVAFNLDFARRRPGIVREQIRGFQQRQQLSQLRR